jgi:hypothetical protein
MEITQPEFEAGVLRAGLSREQAKLIWEQLQNRTEVEGHFEPAHVGYYFGALLVIGAMGWFMTNGWDAFTGFELFAIASAYAAVFTAVGYQLWKQSLFRIPAGLLITIAVCMTPLAVYGLERQFHFWPATYPGSYVEFHPYIKASWVFMEIATVLAAMIALRYFPFPFLTAPAAYALWYMSMDATALMFGKHWTWRQECMISVLFGVLMLAVSYLIDRKTELDYSFWGYLFGLLTFTGGLTLMGDGNQLTKLGYCLIHLVLIGVSLVLQRKVFLVFGSIGVFTYLCNEAYTYFRNSIAFPFVLSGMGVLLIVSAMKFKKNEKKIQERVSEWLSREPAIAEH